jgi:DNA-binding NarL/FixJ family response regulator
MSIMTKANTAVILEDEEMLRGLLVEWLSGQDDVNVIDEFSTISVFNSSLLTTIKDANLIIVDLVLPDGDGLTAALEAMNSLPNKMGLIVISGRPTPDLFARLSENVNGGWAFLLKNSNGLANLRQAINAVQSGLVMVDPGLKKLFSRDGKAATLTEQERAAMDKVAEGKSNAVICQELFTSEKTVERILSSIYSKYGLVGTSKLENPRVRATLIYKGLAK